MTIRTLVVDDDPIAVSVHRSFAERIDGFEVVGEATTGGRALQLVDELRPDLVLLDIYLPDMSGLEVMRRLRTDAAEPVDVIAITGAKDVDSLRTAMHNGVVHYLVKPFSFATFRERLETYATLRTRLERIDQADQGEIDRLYSLLRVRAAGALPKGISAPTLALVVDAVREGGGELSAAEVAEATGIGKGTARRYLEFLSETGTLELKLRYGTAGRPEHRYHWVGAAG